MKMLGYIFMILILVSALFAADQPLGNSAQNNGKDVVINKFLDSCKNLPAAGRSACEKAYGIQYKSIIKKTALKQKAKTAVQLVKSNVKRTVKKSVKKPTVKTTNTKTSVKKPVKTPVKKPTGKPTVKPRVKKQTASQAVASKISDTCKNLPAAGRSACEKVQSNRFKSLNKNS